MLKKGKMTAQQIFPRGKADKLTGEHTPRVGPEGPWEKEIRGMKVVRVCPRCFAVYYDKHWHAWGAARRVADFLRERTVEHMLCAECHNVVSGRGETRWEGELTIRNVRLEEKSQILGVIRKVGARAVRMDPEDQIIKIEDRGSDIRVTTTENRLATRIGKKLDESFKGGTLKITFSHEDEPVRVLWTAPDRKKK